MGNHSTSRTHEKGQGREVTLESKEVCLPYLLGSASNSWGTDTNKFLVWPPKHVHNDIYRHQDNIKILDRNHPFEGSIHSTTSFGPRISPNTRGVFVMD